MGLVDSMMAEQGADTEFQGGKNCFEYPAWQIVKICWNILKHLILKWAQLVKLKSHELLGLTQRHIKPYSVIYETVHILRST